MDLLKQVIIVNFQSIRRVQYDFSEGLNVIIAENGTGKSILNKIIDLMVNYYKYNKEKRNEFIRFGELKSDVYFSSDSESYWVEIYRDKINYYKFENGYYKYESNALPNGLMNLLSLLVCNDGFVGNLITSKQSKLLVDSTDKVNTQTIGLITSDENAELVIDTCESRLKEIGSELRTKVAVKSSLEKELSKIQVVDYTSAENSVNRVYSVIDFADNLVACYEQLNRTQNVGKLNSKLKKVIDLSFELESVLYSLDRVTGVRRINVNKNDLLVLSQLEDLYKQVEDVSYKTSFLSKSKPITFNDNLLGLMSRLEIMKSNLDKVQYKKSVNKVNLEAIKSLEDMYSGVNKLIYSLEVNNRLIEENRRLKEELDSYGGEEYDCPIYGTIKFVNEECIHSNY